MKTITHTPAFTSDVDLTTQLEVKVTKYANGQNAIQLLEDGMPYTTATVAVNVPGEASYPIEENDVVIKNYSENEGILESLIDGGIIEEPHAAINMNFVTLFVAKLK